MHVLLLSKQLFFGFAVSRIIYTTINWTNSCALRFIVKTNTFGALITNYIVSIHLNRLLVCRRIVCT